MPSKDTFIPFIENQLQEYANDEKAPQMEAYMKNLFPFIGVNSTDRKHIIKSIKQEYSIKSKDQLWGIMRWLWDANFREYQYIAMDLSSSWAKKMAIDDIGQIEYFVINKSWWDTVDFLASNLAGGALSAMGTAEKNVANQWINSNNMWLRRTALLFQLKYKERTDFGLLQKFILTTCHEKEFFIRKAAGWALRQYSKFDSIAVGDFINNYETKLSPLTIREGSKYL